MEKNDKPNASSALQDTGQLILIVLFILLVIILGTYINY